MVWGNFGSLNGFHKTYGGLRQFRNISMTYKPSLKDVFYYFKSNIY